VITIKTERVSVKYSLKCLALNSVAQVSSAFKLLHSWYALVTVEISVNI
jgi:hypothetical protein